MYHYFSAKRLLAVALFFAGTFIYSCSSPGPTINERFPVKEPSQLSPPIVSKEIHECAGAVHVSGFIPHAEVTIFANGTEVIGTDKPAFGYADITLTRIVKLGEKVSANQKVGTVTSAQSIIPVTVTAYAAGGFPKPEVSKDIYDCGVIVPVANLVQSTKVHVFEAGTEIGSGPAATDLLPVWTTPLHAGKSITAVQTACETETGKAISSPPSEAVTVKAIPNPVPVPTCDPASLYVGNDAVALGGLLTGAHVTVKDNGTIIGDGYATGSGNWVPLTQVITAASHISAGQEICGTPGAFSQPVVPAGKLQAPVLLQPICAGSRFAIIRNTTINASVVLQKNGATVGYAGAVNGDLIIALGGNNVFAAGDQVTAIQYIGTNNISPPSNTVTVQSKLEVPAVEIADGEPFFLAENGEQSIEGPVFPRGRGAGPRFLIQACCEKKVKVTVKGPGGVVISQPVATEIFPGYFSAVWNWQSSGNWAIPGGIPAGEYTVTVHSDCAPNDVTKKFYVIFNPADVGGPDRFSYDETGIWFYPPPNTIRAVVYHLHPDDKRVFEKAIQAISGQTDPLAAAQLIAKAEEVLFSYSLSYHSDDVIDMIENFHEAQCADDANCLTAMLRSAGIPAHPATGDADIESGHIEWSFDTWTEFLVPGSAGPQWLIIHPHQYPDMTAESRGTFGSTRDVATKGTNDLIVMAAENWNWSEVSDNNADVSFSRPNCTEPEERITKKDWINELCEQGYWSPNHWDCGGLGESSSGLSVRSITVDMGDAGYGRSIAGRITYINRGTKSIEAQPLVMIVGDQPESKKFPDTIFERSVQRLSLSAGDSITLPFKLKLPETVKPGYSLILQVGDGKKTLSLYPFTLSNSFKANLSFPDTLNAGSHFQLRLTVSNSSKQVIRNMSTNIRVPYAIIVNKTDRPLQTSLQPGETKTIIWNAEAIAPLEAGAIRAAIATDNGGSLEILRPIRILSEERIQLNALPEKKKK